ncbi:cytochrome-c peroxidase [Seonamhaeicola maritimus]|uniref:cytochrome-c peroxidase n=1 Tax=Seonamhaeicola maritimus TaxID=2591822 RepID=UPI002495402F|nr:cytochrome c peroxidase [Seonamhaeicola maritimus]
MKASKSFWVLFFVLGGIQLEYCQTNNNQNAHSLREILKPYFILVEQDNEFLIKEQQKIQLGRQLFYDKRLSANTNVSCFSCHDLSAYGTNGTYYLEQKAKGTFYRDVPSVYNITPLPMFNADGSIENIRKKLKQSLLSNYEMAAESETAVEDALKQIDGYRPLFEQSFPEEDAITFDNALSALQMFIQGLVTPAPIDDFIQGDDTALTRVQIEGGHVFNDKNCYSCHTGSNIGGQMVQKLGVTEEWPNQSDLGYYKVFRNPAYKMFFRVSPLRNVDKTTPYFHDASSETLVESIKLMGKHERGLEITNEEALKIEEFLKSLTGDLPLEYIKKPNLPQ